MLNLQQRKLFEFVKEKHKDQKRKYTGEPYHNHLLSVSEIVSKYNPEFIEIALCHDLFEDTNCDFNELYRELIRLEYGRGNAYSICACVKELTDVYTHNEYPYLNRAKRKENEVKRMSKISYASQTVKYADLLDNTNSITEHDAEFSKVYLNEKKMLLEVMINGNQDLLKVVNLEIKTN